MGRVPSRRRAVTVRLLDSGEVALLRQLMNVFGDAFEDRATYGAAPPSDAYLEKLLARDSFIALIALAGDKVVGGITAYDLPKPEQERSEIYLYDLAVTEGHRRQGVATALIATLQRIAAARGAWVVFVQADRGDDRAIALYTQLGRREDVLHFDIPALPGPLASSGPLR